MLFVERAHTDQLIVDKGDLAGLRILLSGKPGDLLVQLCDALAQLGLLTDSTGTANLHPNIGVGTVIADVLLTGLVGVVVDAATGSWYGLVPENVNVTLTRMSGTGPEKINVHVGRASDSGKLEVTSDGPAVEVQVKRQ